VNFIHCITLYIKFYICENTSTVLIAINSPTIPISVDHWEEILKVNKWYCKGLHNNVLCIIHNYKGIILYTVFVDNVFCFFNVCTYFYLFWRFKFHKYYYFNALFLKMPVSISLCNPNFIIPARLQQIL
jgi:hypothetical protein